MNNTMSGRIGNHEEASEVSIATYTPAMNILDGVELCLTFYNQ